MFQLPSQGLGTGGPGPILALCPITGQEYYMERTHGTARLTGTYVPTYLRDFDVRLLWLQRRHLTFVVCRFQDERLSSSYTCTP